MNGQAIIMESDTNEPAVIRNTSSGPGNVSWAIEFYNASSVIFRNLIVELENDDATGFIASYNDVDSPPTTIMNNVFYKSISGVPPQLTFQGIETYGSTTIVGNTFKYVGVSHTNSKFISLVGQANASYDVLISSNYAEGNVNYFLNEYDQGHPNIYNGYIRNNYVYNNSDSSFQMTTIETQSGLSVTGNVDNHLLPSQFVSYTGTYSGDHSVLIPGEGSALRDAGYPESGWDYDIFGTLRHHDVGAGEHIGDEPVTCWKYTAKYRGSNRSFVMNGGGKYPSTLQVPGNVDISTGRMIDEGQLIDPSQFNVIQ